jgi:hypothetical protein
MSMVASSIYFYVYFVKALKNGIKLPIINKSELHTWEDLKLVYMEASQQ